MHTLKVNFLIPYNPRILLYLNPDEFQHFVKRNDLCLFHAPIKISKVENTVLRTIDRIENH